MRELSLEGPRSLFGAILRDAAFRLLRAIRVGQLAVVDDGERFEFGSPGSLAVTATVHDPAVYRAILLGGSVGAGEAFVKGHWTSDDLPGLVQLFVRNLEALEAMEGGALRLGHLATALFTKALRRNTRAGSRRNIARHYDLSNEFFALFLDRSMTYSSGIFESELATLEDAQLKKLDRVCQKLALGKDDHVLEIGTGWGSFAIYAASTYGCRVTTTTVSTAQRSLAMERIRALGLEDRITVLLRDYRDLEGEFDKLVSIEMIEAVGDDYMDDYFRACTRHLKADGLMLLQAITISDQHYEAHRTSLDFIKQYIFPGSSIPSVTSILDATTRATDLRLFHMEDLTPHYARTLRLWRERFLARTGEVKQLGFDDEFLRTWEYYLAYCEGAFMERYLASVQMVLTKPGARPPPIRALYE